MGPTLPWGVNSDQLQNATINKEPKQEKLSFKSRGVARAAIFRFLTADAFGCKSG